MREVPAGGQLGGVSNPTLAPVLGIVSGKSLSTIGPHLFSFVK